jgi:hypothetical protein
MAAGLEGLMMTVMRTFAAVLLVGAAFANGEDVVFFDSKDAPATAWRATGLGVQRMDTTVLFTENDPAAKGGHAHVTPFMPYVQDADIECKLNGLAGGTCAVQLQFISGEGNALQTVDLFQFKGPGKEKLEKLPDAPDGTKGVTLKIALTDQDGAKAQLGLLRYAYPLHGRKKLADEDAIKGDVWQIESLEKIPGPGPKTFGLRAGDKTGSILFTPQFPWSANNGSRLFIHLPTVTKGTVTVQVQPLDDGNQALPAVDAIPAVGAGWHTVDLGSLNLDAMTTKLVLKFWLGGEQDAKFSLDRLVVVAQ